MLVVAEKEQALRSLTGKIPPGIKDLVKDSSKSVWQCVTDGVA